MHTAIANTGGFSPAELKVIEQKALALGAASHVTLDIEQEYYEKSIKYMVFGNILRNGTYPISVSSGVSSRPSPSSSTPRRSAPTMWPTVRRAPATIRCVST